MQQEVLTTPHARNTITGYEQAPIEDATALGAASMDAVGFEFSDADLAFLATGDESVLAPAIHEPGLNAEHDGPLAPLDQRILDRAGIDVDSLTGKLSDEERKRLERQDVASAKAASDYFARQDAEAAAHVVAAEAARAERHFVQTEIIDREEAAAKKKKSDLALAA